MREKEKENMDFAGEIIEQGSHQELMACNGQYAEMFRCQEKYYQENAEIFG